MKPRVLSYRAASQVRQPILLELVDQTGEPFDVSVPGDLPADSWLDFVETFSNQLEGEIMPAKVILPWLRLVFGDKLDDVRKRLSMKQLQQVGTDLWEAYTTPEEDNDENPPMAPI